MSGISNAGFVPKTTREIREELVTDLSLIQDPDTGEYPFFNIGDDTVLSQVVGIFAEALATAWAELAEVYAQFDPQMNTGAGQSATVQLNALTRKSGTYSQIYVTLTGDAGSNVEKGALISDMSGSTVFALDKDIVFEGGSNTVVLVQTTATATVMGDLDPDIDTIIQIQTPTSGWRGVTNTGTITVGTTEENDDTLRLRQQRSTSMTAYRHVEAIWAALCNIDGVTYARVYQNSSTYPVDDRGIPYKEVAAVVQGGKDEDIANVLFYRLPTGQVGYGNVGVNLTDSQNIVYGISFTRPVEQLVYIKMTLRVYDAFDWPDDGKDEIRQAIINYAKYNMTDEDIGFPPGCDIIRSRLYTPINSVLGHSILSLELSADGQTYAEQDLTIPWNHLGVFLAENIEIDLM